MQTLAYFYGLRDINCYSGGTESTSIPPAIMNTLHKSGFRSQKLADGNNPIYGVKYDENANPIFLFSKRYDHFINPIREFAVVMVCTQADQECPIIPGAEQRFSIPYVDPMNFDGTSRQVVEYQERCAQIGAELLYVVRESMQSCL